MAEIPLQHGIEGLRRNRYAAVANEYLAEKNLDGAKKSLELLLREQGISNRVVNHCIDGALASENGIKLSIRRSAEDYGEIINALSMNDLFAYFRSEVPANFFSGEREAKVNTLVAPFAEQTYGQIAKRVNEANFYLKGAKEGAITLSDERKTEYENTKNRYQSVLEAVGYLDRTVINSLKVKVNQENDEESWYEFVKELPAPETN